MGKNGKRFQNNHRRQQNHFGKHRGNQQKNFNRKPKQNNETPRQNIVHTSLKENEIGITEYVTPSEGFTGIIKQRISDFHVNEIGFDGNLCKLTDFTLPKPTKNEAEKPANLDDFIKLITQETYDKIDAIEKDSKCAFSVLIDVTDMDKGDRGKIHYTIKENFNHVSSITMDEDDRKFIKCYRHGKKNDRRTRWVWPHEYTYFLLHKENIDTMQAISSLAPLLNGAKASSITYAGTKDKRGKTTQWACIRRRDPLTVVRAAQRLKNIFVGNFTFRDQPLKLGQLQGNRFRIALRQVTASEELITQVMENFQENGFINYYGTQRFGNHASVPTHKIGTFLVQGDFKSAIEWILKPREAEGTEMEAVRKLWWDTRDAGKALDLLQKRDRGGRSIEYKLLFGLKKHGTNDYLNALENIPRNTRLMYIHSYQSLIWNEIASRRIAEYGLELQEGDLVYSDSEQQNTEILDELACDDEAENVAENGAEQNEDADEKASSNPSRFLTMVKPLTKADIESDKYTIFDIVLPLPGHDITYPSNECGKWYEERLLQDNLTSEKFKQKQKTYSLTGAYRKVFLKPKDCSWRFMKYNNERDTLIRSDLEELRGEKEPESIENGTQKALILEFTLPTSTYATMALREILKCDTSVANQIQLQIANEPTPDLKRAADAVDNDDETDAKKAKVEETVEVAEAVEEAN